MEKIKLRLDDEGIEIPFPQRDVHLYQAGESAA
jgi:small conductance mechanosensitive channel